MIDLTKVDVSTVEVADLMGKAMFPGGNATFDKGPKGADMAAMDAVAYLNAAFFAGAAVLLKGAPGCGKTSLAKAYASALAEVLPTLVPGFEGRKVEVCYINAPNSTPEDMVFPMPKAVELADGTTERRLDFMLFGPLMRAATDPNTSVVLIIDEPARASGQVQNQLLELVSGRTLAGRKIPGLIGIIGCDNVAADDGIHRQADLTFADRWVTVEVDANEIPWRFALAERFADTDLGDVFKTYARLTPMERRALSPRTLEHVIWCLLHGLPGFLGLPIAGGRCRIVNESGQDRTDEILADVAAALRVPSRDKAPSFHALLELATRHGKNVFVQGPPGIGKTSEAKAYLAAAGFDTLHLSMPVTSPENLAFPAPTPDGRLETMLLEWLSAPAADGSKGKVLLLDEVWRAPAPTRNKVMEVLQEGSIAGAPIRDLVCVIALNNPKEVAGFKLEVGKPDRAQADRFFMSTDITAADTSWATYLIETHGELAELFIEWWKEAIDDRARVLISPRCLERMIKLHLLGLDVDKARPFIAGEYVPISTHELKAMLANRPVTHLKAVVENVERYESLLEGELGRDNPAQWDVFHAFSTAELIQLERNREVVVRLLRHLNRQNTINLLLADKEVQRFWMEALKEAKEDKIRSSKASKVPAKGKVSAKP